jgi:hypothetical protein
MVQSLEWLKPLMVTGTVTLPVEKMGREKAAFPNFGAGFFTGYSQNN